ncbi:MAG: HAD family hydrolase [Actinomycetota bacterium]
MTELDVDAVIFDVGGVFVVPDPTRVRAELADLCDLTAVADDAFVRAHYHGIAAYDRSFDQPERWPAYLEDYLGSLDVEVTGAILERGVALWTTPTLGLWVHRIDAHARALRDLAATTRLGMISNADGTIEDVLLATAVAQVGQGDGVEVEVIVDSHVVGVTKPDPTIFPFALEPMGLPAHRCAYVGDSFRNDVEGARAAGLTPVHLDPYGLGPDGDHLRIGALGDLRPLLASQ